MSTGKSKKTEKKTEEIRSEEKKEETKEVDDDVSDKPSKKEKTVKKTEKKKMKKIKLEKFKIENLKVKPIDFESDMNKDGYQYVSYVEYTYPDQQVDEKGSLTRLECKPIKFTAHGIKRIDGKFITSDEKRQFIWVPLDKEQDNCKELFKVFDIIDKYGKSKEVVDILFAGNLKSLAKKASYVPINREAEIPVNTDKTKKYKTTERPNYAKVMLDIYTDRDKEIDKSKVGKIKTALFEKDLNAKKTVSIDDVETVKDLERYVGYQSVADFIISINKVWVAKSASNGVYQYGFGLKFTQIRVLEKPSKGGLKEDTKTCQLSGSDDDSDDEIEKKEEKKRKDEPKEENTKKGDSDSEEEDKPKKEDKKKKKDDSESEEENKPKKVDKKKKKDDSDEEDKPKKGKSKGKKKEESDDEDDDANAS